MKIRKNLTLALISAATLVFALPQLAQERQAKEPSSLDNGMEAPLNQEKMHFTNDLSRFAMSNSKQVKNTVNDAGEEIDDHGIIVAPPQGETHYYKRSGKAYYYDDNWNFYSSNQGGHVTIVETPDGAVYVKDIISHYAQNSWVRGAKSGNTLTIPVGQPLTYDTQYGITLSLHWGTTDNNWGMLDTQDVTFTINGSTLSLENSSASSYIGAFWDGGYNTFSGWGDYNTMWTLDENYTPASQDLVTLPSGIATQEWYSEGTIYEGDNFESNVTVAKNANDIYVKGIFTTFPDSWIKGVVDGNKVTFAQNQFLGYMNDGTPVWATGYGNSGLGDITFYYDSEANEYDSQTIVLANGSDDQVIYAEAFSDFSFMPEKPGTVMIDELPYLNNFETKARRRPFTIIDNNGDNSTWDSGLHSNSGSYMFYYSYNANNAGDDWLISPAIKLEEGKHYRFSLNAWAQNSANVERLEVMLGRDINAASMTQTIINATDINHSVIINIAEESQLLENTDFTVAKTGYYYFGIHAISEKDRYYLYIDNFNVALATTAESPAAATNVSVTQEPGMLADNVSFTAPAVTISGNPITENLASVNVYRDGEPVASLANVAPGSQQSISDNNGLSLGQHDYYVVATSNSGEGEKSDTVQAFITLTQPIPVVYDFTTQNFNQSLVIDANGDGRSWNGGLSDGATYTFGHIDANEYLITQPAHLEAGISYNITVNACSNGTEYPESFELLMGKGYGLDDLDIVAMEPTQVQTEDNDYQDYSCDVTVAETGDYFIALHCISTVNDGFIFKVKKILVNKNASANGPAAPAITVTAEPMGKTEALVSVTAPTTCIDGSLLGVNLSHLDILRDDNMVNTTLNVAPGATISFNDTTATKGTHTYYAIAYDADGNPGATSERITLYVGQDIPKAIYDVRYADNGDGYTLMWDKVDSIGRNNGYVNPALVYYVISDNKVSEIAGVEYDDVGDEIGRVQDENFFTFTGLNTDEGEQHLVPYYVRTENIAGATTDYQKYIIIGEPYQLPVEESFTGNAVHTLWDYSDATSLGASSDASDGDGNAARLGPSGTYGVAELETGKINLKTTVQPVLSFDVKKGLTNENELTIYAVLPDGSKVDLQTVAITNAFVNNKISLNDETLKQARFARIGFRVDFAFPALNHYVILDNIKIEDNAIYGDVNGDGQVTSIDVTALYNYLLNNDMSSIVNGDVDNDGYITSGDISSVYNILLTQKKR